MYIYIHDLGLFTMNGTTNDTELDAVPVDPRCPVARGTRGQLPNNRISNAEPYSNHPHPVEPIDLFHFVFVYDYEDWTKFNEFSDWFKDIVSTLPDGNQVKMEKYDSQVFPPIHDENVHEICERAIFILPFLSQNFCMNKQLKFFLSEGIGKTRLDQTPVSSNLSDVVKKQKKYAIRPVFTTEPSSRTYFIPTGLTMMKGINFFNKEKEYVKYYVTDLINDAMKKFNERKDAMLREHTEVDRFGRIHGPPPSNMTTGATAMVQVYL